MNKTLYLVSNINVVSMEEKLTLLQLQEMIQEGVSEIFPQSLQLVSEVSSVKENASGHCYLELVE